MMKPRWNSLLAGALSGFLLAAVILLAAPASGADRSDGATSGTPDQAAEAQATTASQREAAALLRGMTEYLASLQSFGVAFRAGYDVVQSTGQKIEFGETRRVTLARPDRLRVEEVASDGKRDLVIFDGHHISVLDADAGVYAQAPQPGTVDDALGYFVRDLRMRMPLALLLTTRLPDILHGTIRAIDYVESTEILGVPTHHVAGRADRVDFQFWIAEGERPLPLRVVITYPNSPGKPQYWANFADWNTSPQLPKTMFQFTPPPDARQIAFAVQVQRSAATPQPPASNAEIQP